VKQHGFAPILIVIILAAAALGGYFWFSYSNNQTKTAPTIKACTMDAKLCSDGSSVGRIPPNCNFAPCPSPKESTSSADMTNWKTYVDNKGRYSYNYPGDFRFRSQNNIFISSDAKLSQTAKGVERIGGIELGSMYFGPGEDIENYSKDTPDTSVVSRLKLPANYVARAYIQEKPEQIIVVDIDNKPSNFDSRIGISCSGDNIRCKSLLTQILSTFKFVN